VAKVDPPALYAVYDAKNGHPTLIATIARSN
jgi:hypothetical protein